MADKISPVTRNILFLDSAHSDDDRRRRIYQGQIYLYSPRQAVLEMVNLARQLIEEAFYPLNPETAQYEMDVKEFEALLNKLKPQFVRSEEGKRIMKRILEEMGCDVEKTYFDLPRMRTATSDNYLTTGIAYSFDAHRDSWFSGPLNQINWWFPIYDVQPENAMVFYPEYFGKHVNNSSYGYNCHEWNAYTKKYLQGQVKEDTRKRPMPLESISQENEMIIIPPVGSMIVFSGTHLHASIPNFSGRTRFSIDFRTVHLDDVRNHVGAPNVDNYCKGTIMRDFIHPTTFELLPPELIQEYENGTPVLDPFMEREQGKIPDYVHTGQEWRW